MKRYLKLTPWLTVWVLIVVGCEQAPDDLFNRQFLIRQGEHYATPRIIESLQTDRLRFRARFNESARYELANLALQSNKNKLLGFADCNSQHHENSARFAWQWYNQHLEIYAYCYVNAQRVEAYVGTVNLHEENAYEIKMTPSHYVFSLNGEEAVRIARGTTCKEGVYYMLWPYFGGSEAAPHDIQINVNMMAE